MLFWIIAALMTAAATALLLVPLLRPRGTADSRARYDLEIYRDQMKEVDRDLARGVIDESQAVAARAEVGRRMLTVADEAETAVAPTPKRARWLAVALCLLIPLGALAVYLPIGQPELPGQPFAQRAPAPGNDAPPREIMQALARLEQHLKEDPRDLQGWMLLGQAYNRMGRYADSAGAYRQAMAVSQGSDPEIMSAFGEALTAANDGMVPDEAVRTFEAILKVAPKEPRARYYLALTRAQAGDYRDALDRWADIVRDSPADAPWLRTVRQRIAEMAERLSVPVAEVMPQPLPASQPQASTGGPTREQAEAAADMSPEQRTAMVRGMVERLANRLKDNPDDADGWLRLARAYRVMGDAAQEASALNSAMKAAPKRVDVLVAYADSRIEASAEGAPLPAEAIEALREVMAQQPDNPQALYWLGLNAANAAQPLEAAELWGRLLAQIDPKSPEYAELRSRIDGLKQGG
jgi:cytochrome c-type biogenesis protein CcmH